MNTDFDISNLKKCIITLETCLNDYKISENDRMREYIEDSCVQRFEYTIETAWKLMKKYLKTMYGKSDVELTVNNIFRYMEGYGFIKSWEKWRDYYKKRNDTSHEYNREKAVKILDYANSLLNDAKYLYEKLSLTIGENK